jgi:hypothetical protein
MLLPRRPPAHPNPLKRNRKRSRSWPEDPEQPLKDLSLTPKVDHQWLQLLWTWSPGNKQLLQLQLLRPQQLNRKRHLLVLQVRKAFNVIMCNGNEVIFYIMRTDYTSPIFILEMNICLICCQYIMSEILEQGRINHEAD